MKSSHFERSELRRRGSSTSSLLTETVYGARTQDGDCRVSFSITSVTLVSSADRTSPGHRPRHGGKVPQAVGNGLQNPPFRPPGRQGQNQPLTPGAGTAGADDNPADPAAKSADSKPAIPPAGPWAKTATFPPWPSGRILTREPASRKVTPSSADRAKCQPHRRRSWRSLEQGLSAQRIFQDLVVEHGFAGGYDSVKRFVRKLVEAARCPCGGWSALPGKKPKLTSHGRADRRAGRQTPQDACFSHRLEPQPQGVQRGDVSADDGGLHRLSGKRLLAFRRLSKGPGDRQPSRAAVKHPIGSTRSWFQAAVVSAALRRGDLAHQALTCRGTRGRWNRESSMYRTTP